MRKPWMLVIAALALSCHRESTSPQLPPSLVTGQQPYGKPASPQQIARGEYVAQIAGCSTCHGGTLGGGTEVKLGAGTARMPNISPDRDTGIGAWSDTQIIAAVRRGLRPDGTRLAPLMPYAYYNRMTDGDAAALVAYLRAQAPVRHEVARSENLPMKPIDVAEPRGSVDRVHDLHAHGEYIATLMHCAACHTPMEGSLANQAYAGGTRFGDVVAPNITPDRDTGIGSWSEDDIIRAVREMKDPSGHKLHPPMADYREDWAHLTGTDAHALVIFLRKVPPVHHELEETQHPVSQQP